jgi:predicted ArsR family transcriptional regulator
VANQETSTRRSIIILLRTEGPLSAGDLAERIGITEMAIRRHIATLERDHLIYPTTIRQPMGRPAKVYHLTEEADDLFPKNYHTLTLDLLEDLVRVDGEAKVQQLFNQREERLVQQFEEVLAGKTLEEKVSIIADLQNRKGYLARWEAKQDGSFEIIEYNCPIAQVSKLYPQTCACETNVFRRVLGTDVSRSECLAEGGKCCVFRVGRLQPATE